nr:MucR family transcriptional regulator [Nitrosomonas nitrosa]
MTDAAPASESSASELLALTVEIVASYVSNNAVTAASLPGTITAVHTKLAGLGAPAPVVKELIPAVPVKKSVADDHLVCLDCGASYKMLKRHLANEHGLAPGAYRMRWGLPADYPMVASRYAEVRRKLAVSIGPGRKPVEPPKPAAKGKKAKTKK